MDRKALVEPPRDLGGRRDFVEREVRELVTEVLLKVADVLRHRRAEAHHHEPLIGEGCRRHSRRELRRSEGQHLGGRCCHADLDGGEDVSSEHRPELHAARQRPVHQRPRLAARAQVIDEPDALLLDRRVLRRDLGRGVSYR